MLGMRVGRMLWLLAIFLTVSPPAICQTDPAQLSAITSALAGNEFDRALVLLEPAIQQSPRNPKIWTLEALALSGKGNKKAALLAFQKALNISPEFLPAIEGAAQIQYDAGSQDAVPLLKHLLRLRPNDPTSHAMLAFLAYKKGDCPEAIEHFSLSGSLVDTQPETREEYAACLVKLKRLEQAISLLESAVARDPQGSSSRYQLAAIQLMVERPKDALLTLGPLLQTENPDIRTLEMASAAYEADGNTPLAVTTLRKAIVQDPHNADLYIDFAVLSMDHQSYQVGIEMITVGLEAEPKAAPLYVARGVLYVQLAQYSEAESDFDKADELEPNQAIGSVAQGLEQEQANDLDRALGTVQSKLASKPNDPKLLYLRADILTQMGQQPGSPNFQTALRSARRAVALEPTLVAARDILAKLYLQAGQSEAAITQCREALKIDPKDQTALYRLIQALRKTEKKSEIPDLLKRLAELRAEGTKEEREHNRYKLVEAGTTPNAPSEP